MTADFSRFIDVSTAPTTSADPSKGVGLCYCSSYVLLSDSRLERQYSDQAKQVIWR